MFRGLVTEGHLLWETVTEGWSLRCQSLGKEANEIQRPWGTTNSVKAHKHNKRGETCQRGLKQSQATRQQPLHRYKSAVSACKDQPRHTVTEQPRHTVTEQLPQSESSRRFRPSTRIQSTQNSMRGLKCPVSPPAPGLGKGWVKGG